MWRQRGSYGTRIPVFLFALIFFGLFSTASAQESWQAVLEREFEVVETFDELKNWSGKYHGGYDYNQANQAKRTDNAPIPWEYFYADNSGVAPAADWIADHGPEYTWKGKGKSLCLNPIRVPKKTGFPLGYGPGKFGMYVGNGSPASGFKKIHIFFMVKFGSNAFILDGAESFEWVGVFKFLHIGSGFREAHQWGTEAEQQTVYNNAQNRYIYGQNGTLFNMATEAGGLLFPKEESALSEYQTGCDCYRYAPYIKNRRWRENNGGPFYFRNEWVAMEYMLDIGTLGNADGKLEIWYYDRTGNVIGYSEVGGEIRKERYDHRYNKISWGGNRLGTAYAEDDADPNDSRYYIDDIVISGNRVGPKYFALLKERISPKVSGVDWAD